LGNYEETMIVEKLEPGFNERAAAFVDPAFPDIVFDRFCLELKWAFDKDRITILEVLETFKKLGIPAPQKHGEFLSGKEGLLVFLNKYGIVIRIEKPDEKLGFRAVRVNDEVLVAKPLASLKAGGAVIEISLGVRQETKPENVKYLREALAARGIEYWDHKLSNTGRAPIYTPHWPDGVPIVIDRGAVRRLTKKTKPISDALKKKYAMEAAEARKALEEIAAPLRQAFKKALPNKKALPDPEKMKAFWKLCEGIMQQGKLVAGWCEPQSQAAKDERPAYGDNGKTPEAAKAAKRYAARLQSAVQATSSTLPAVLQSPRPQV
jgi:hypothetical protein